MDILTVIEAALGALDGELFYVFSCALLFAEQNQDKCVSNC